MESPSQLDLFLRDHRDDGEVVNEGSFTISRDKALQKLADFSLPFAGAWAVKAIQAIVSAQNRQPIKVVLTRSETRFIFCPSTEWTLDDLEQAFFDPEPGSDRGVNYLMACLWAVGVGEKRPFLLALPGQQEALIWDGAKTHRQPHEESQSTAHLTISSQIEGSGWFGSTGSNADVTKALAEYCYTCPVALTVDGRRIDGLHFSPIHGWGKESFPLALAFPEADLPAWGVPPGTFDNLVSPEMADSVGGGLKDVTLSALANATPQREAKVAALVTAHVKSITATQNKDPEPKPTRSHCYWVQDGVVVDRDAMGILALPCSVGFYLSAEGLEHDLSGFALSKSELRDERKLLAANAIGRDFRSLSSANLEEIVAGADRRAKRAGIGFIIVGIGVAFLSPYHGVAGIAAGAMAYTQGGRYKRQWAEKNYRFLDELAGAWKKSYPG